VAVHGGPDIVNEGLILCLDAGNSLSYSGSGTQWTDLSGSGNHGVLANGITHSSQNYGGVLKFDRTDDHAYCPITIQSIDVSYETVVDSVTNQYNWFAAGDPPQSTTFVYVRSYPTYTNMAIYNAVGEPSGWKVGVNVNHSGIILQSAKMYHFVFTNSSSNWKFYINGDLMGEVNYFRPNYRTAIKLGGSAMQSFSANTSAIALSRVYSRILTADEIRKNFESSRGRFGL
jgi:hypothetical protein